MPCSWAAAATDTRKWRLAVKSYQVMALGRGETLDVLVEAMIQPESQYGQNDQCCNPQAPAKPPAKEVDGAPTADQTRDE